MVGNFEGAEKYFNPTGKQKTPDDKAIIEETRSRDKEKREAALIKEIGKKGLESLNDSIGSMEIGMQKLFLAAVEQGRDPEQLLQDIFEFANRLYATVSSANLNSERALAAINGAAAVMTPRRTAEDGEKLQIMLDHVKVVYGEQN
jgi:hypothetical protein